MTKQNTSGLVLTSFRPGDVDLPPGAPTDMDDLVADESMYWQDMSSIAASAARYMLPDLISRVYRANGVEHQIPRQPERVPEDPNRILEIHGLMGAVGEQVGLALTADLDARRLINEALEEPDRVIHYRFRIRAIAEMSAYFTLGAAHSVANLALRILLLYPSHAGAIDPKGTKYPPGKDSRNAWDTLNGLSQTFVNQIEFLDEGPLRRLISAVLELQSSVEFKALEKRRGMDFHRRRPQSVEHRAPTAGIYTNENGFPALRMPVATLQPEADPDAVHAIAQAGLHKVAQMMRIIRMELGPALRAEGFTYIW